MFFAKPHFIIDEERRRTKSAACHRALGVGNEFGFYRRQTARLNDLTSIESGFGQGGGPHFGIIKFLVRHPHVVVHRLNVSIKHIKGARCNGATHERQRVYREVRGVTKVPDTVFANETLDFQPLIFRLVANRLKSQSGRLIACCFEYAAQQHRDVVKLDARSRLDRGDHSMAQECIRAAEIEQELHLWLAHHFSPKGRISCSNVQASGDCEYMAQYASATDVGLINRLGSRLASASAPSRSAILPRTKAVSTPASITR